MKNSIVRKQRRGLRMIYLQLTKVLATLSIIEASRAVRAICPPSGPWLPEPTALGRFHSFSSATENLERQIKGALKGEIEAGWPVANASFSISVVSSDDLVDGRPLWEYHHLAEANINGTKQVDGDSQYLIGSVSKLISELVFLKAGIDMDEKITEFLPELEDDSSFIKWNQISLNSLATHLSGIAPNCKYISIFKTL
jgi:CubicO group peptidase (beta-lactamase class C family)